MTIESDSTRAPAASGAGESGPFRFAAGALAALLVHLLGLLARVVTGGLLVAGVFPLSVRFLVPLA